MRHHHSSSCRGRTLREVLHITHHTTPHHTTHHTHTQGRVSFHTSVAKSLEIMPFQNDWHDAGSSTCVQLYSVSDSFIDHIRGASIVWFAVLVQVNEQVCKCTHLQCDDVPLDSLHQRAVRTVVPRCLLVRCTGHAATAVRLRAQRRRLHQVGISRCELNEEVESVQARLMWPEIKRLYDSDSNQI